MVKQMTIIQDLINLHNKWDAEGGKSGSDSYEDALYKCINELGDLINKAETSEKAVKQNTFTLTKEGKVTKLLLDLVCILTAYENNLQLVSDQGQSLDGFAALANFLDVAKKAKEVLSNYST